MKSELKKYALDLQRDIDSLTENLKRPCKDYAYWDGRNDTLLEVLVRLEKILKIE